MTRAARLRGAAGVVLLLGAAYAVVQWEPWHGPVILTLSAAHGIHMGDLLALPLVALAVAIGRAGAQGRPRRALSPASRWALPASAVPLGALLLLARQLTRRPAGSRWCPPAAALSAAAAPSTRTGDGRLPRTGGRTLP